MDCLQSPRVRLSPTQILRAINLAIDLESAGPTIGNEALDVTKETTQLPELFIVEGESAGLAVERVCDRNTQRVITMQGKPMNAWKASRVKVTSNPWFQRVIESLGSGIGNDFHIDTCPYSKIVFLFDPDADGIHCTALMLWFFHRWMNPLLESGRIFIALPPLCELRNNATQQIVYPCHPKEIEQYIEKWNLPKDSTDISKKTFRGLASIGSEILLRTCIDPAMRKIRRARPEDAIASLEAFTGKEL
jgi:DNA gyrase subunit B